MKPLRVSFDIGGVLSKYPRIFRPMVEALQKGGAEVYVLTDIHKHEESVQLVQGNGYDIPADSILNSDYETHGEDCKAVLIKERWIDLHIDDFPGYCAHTECVSLFVWPNPNEPYYHDEFNDFLPEGANQFGRRRKSRP